ncbi:predicted protein [Lichtheimia corymbifera JMRC:FSU:9682]|uniref:Uncharacterized protein n=1 Tax=Lichtheimia corymbifera JMRC:FSU:9682 TaxID=1263082 RepID=A0A068S8T6_9FUNG|nr:predicted protein [Lichtheimia corymbifera JMRC:FSU:9682]
MTTWPNITTLSINYTEDDELSRTQIIGICQRFPALTNFDVHPFPDIETVLMVPRYCPLLNCAKIHIHAWHITGFFSNETTGSDEVVVKELTVYEDDWLGNQTIVDTAPVLNQYHATLEHIEWDITPDRDFRHLYNIHYPGSRNSSFALLDHGY